MVVDINNWIKDIECKIKSGFGSKVLFIGYQGSYSRLEATEESDIDIVVILDKLEVEDLKKYKNIIDSMPYSEKACGFISGKNEIINWSKPDIFQFWHETKPLFGDLSKIITPLGREDVKCAVKIGAQNLYHAACHAYLYDNDIKQSLARLYKMVFFILQSEYFYNTDEYIPTKKELVKKLSGENKTILEICMDKENIISFDAEKIDNLYDKLITWCSMKIIKF